MEKAQFTRNFFEFNFKFQGITTTDKMIQCITTQYLVQHLAIMLSVIMLSVIILSFVLMSVVMLSVNRLSASVLSDGYAERRNHGSRLGWKFLPL